MLIFFKISTGQLIVSAWCTKDAQKGRGKNTQRRGLRRMCKKPEKGKGGWAEHDLSRIGRASCCDLAILFNKNS